MNSVCLFACLMASSADPSRPASPPPSPGLSAPVPAPASPFRLGLTYVHTLSEDGDLTNNNLATNALGLDFVSSSNTYVRSHFGLAHQWESSAGYSARGFRIDLISFGYPIRLVDSTVRLDLEPILTVIRGEIMFVSGGNAFLRLESGFGLELSATLRRWFVTVQPLAIDFRYWVYSSTRSQTGFGRIFPFRVAVGHEF
jgi:hypothetical protein